MPLIMGNGITKLRMIKIVRNKLKIKLSLGMVNWNEHVESLNRNFDPFMIPIKLKYLVPFSFKSN